MKKVAHPTRLGLLLSIAAATFAPPVAFAQTRIPPETMKRIGTLLQKEQCLDHAQLATKEWSRILDLYVVGPTPKTNVEMAFKNLKALHAEDLTKLEAFAKVPVPSTTSPAELSKAIEDLQGERSNLTNQRDAVRKADVEFLGFVGNAEQALVDMVGILSRTPSTCDAAVKSKLEAFREDASKRREEVTLARKYVAQASPRRERMFELSYETRKAALLLAHSKATGTALDALKAQIDGTLALGDLLPEFKRWSFQKIANGYGDGEITYYLQYETGLANLEKELVEAYAWRKRFEDIKGVPEATRDIALSSVDSFIANLTSMRTKYEGMGWQGFLARQRLLVDGMLKIRNKYPLACGPLLDHFEQSTRTVPSIVEYRAYERDYKMAMKVCRSGNRGVAP